MTLVDSLISILIPFFLIIISNTVLGFELINHATNFSKSIQIKFHIYDKRKPSRRIKKISKITKILFTISSTFLVLNLPITVIKLWSFFKNYDQYNHLSSPVKKSLRNQDSIDDSSPTFNEDIIEKISRYLYYLNFSINFFLYTLNESKFSNRLINLFKIKSINNH